MRLLLCCKKTKPYLYRQDDDTFKLENKIVDEDISDYKKYYGLNNGKIIIECDYEVEELYCDNYCDERDGYVGYFHALPNDDFEEGEKELQKKSCLDELQINGYLQERNGYAIHIKNLHIFDKSKELNDYYKFDGIYNDINNWKTIDKAPQNMMYAYDLISELGFSGTYNMQLIKKVLISIKPQWMCKILNGEKTIEVRKVVLKEMLKDE